MLACVTYGMMRSSEQQMLEARQQFRLCESMVSDIKKLQNRPGFAALGVDSARTITARAEEAVEKASISSISLARIEPQSALRLRDSDYRLRPTRLQLRKVSLKQVLAFTHAMIDETHGTTIRDLRITASDEPENSDSWTAELVLTQLIFSPSDRPQGE